MSQLKARLAVVLKADDVVVAEAEDPLLWQRVLRAINAGTSELPDVKETRNSNGAAAATPNLSSPEADPNISGEADTPLGKLARQLGLAENLVRGACDPTTSEPYMQLDMHNWSAVKTQLPPRGASALSPIVVASTLLGLWLHAAGLGNPTQAQAQRVLNSINVYDKNPTRGLRGAPWLQPRPGGQVLINAAQVQRAILLAKCFCSQDWKPWKAALAEE
jgi:hypothetical protein